MPVQVSRLPVIEHSGVLGVPIQVRLASQLWPLGPVSETYWGLEPMGVESAMDRFVSVPDPGGALFVTTIW